MTLTPDPNSPVNALADRFWEGVLETSPTLASFYGDDRWAGDLEDTTAHGRAVIRALMERTAAEAAAIPVDGLSTEDRITRDMLRVIAELQVEEDDQGFHQLRTVDQMSGPQQLLPWLTQFQPADTPETFEAFVSRLHAYPAFWRAHRDPRRGARDRPDGAAHRRRADDRPDRADARDPDRAGARASMVKVASDADRERIRDIVRDVVTPADVAFLDALKGDYLAASREDPGIWSAPNGDALYRTAIRSWTSLDLDPAEVHAIGMAQLETIEAERREIARAAGFGDDTAAYRQALGDDPANIPGSKDELVGRAAEDIERAMAIAPQYFGVLPRAHCEVRAVEEYKEKDAPFAYYYPPKPDGTRDGIYYANGYDLPSRKYTKLASTTYHEAAPGHHFQITLETENPHLNAFRRLGARVVGGAYVEGWGLYSERLADEMGLYRNEGERFGMLDAQAWRAGRLVVDTGIHGLRWPRQRSIDFLLGAGLSETDAVIETDRYICWPGQALTYMIGQLEIQRLRAELEARDGSASTCGPSTTRSSATGRCPWPPCRENCPTGWRRPSDLARPARSPRPIVEADPEGVQRPEQDPAPAFVAVGAVELVADQVDRDRAEGFRRERERRALDDPELEQVGLGPEDEVADDAARPAARPDAEAGVAEGVRHAPAHGLPERDRESRGRIDGAAPAVREAESVELRERPEELRLQLLERGRSPVKLRTDLTAEVVDRVVAAPQDPVVGREAEVVELVVRVRQALATGPADRAALVGRQRLRDEDVVVDGHERLREPAQPAGVGGGRDDDLIGAQRRAVRGRHAHATGPTLEAGHAGVLVDADPTLGGDPGKTPTQLGRVHQDVAPGRPVQAGMPERGVDLGPGGIPIQEFERFAVLGGLVDPRLELVDLVRLVGQRQHAGLLEVAFDVVRPCELDQTLEVGHALAFEAFEFVGEVQDPVRQPMRQGRLAESAVPTAGPERDRLRLEDDDPERRVRVRQGDGGPQTGEATADDHDIHVVSPAGSASKSDPARAASS